MIGALPDFLLARIAEDERLANEAVDTWSQVRIHYGTSADAAKRLAREAFVLNINPWRIQRECEAKRRMVEAHGDANAGWDHDDEFGVPAICNTCHDYDKHDAATWPCLTLRLLALPYATHADYRSEWAP